jgi:hypothetical protein
MEILLLQNLELLVKKVYNIPKTLIIKYEGHKLWFSVTKDETKDNYEVDV